MKWRVNWWIATWCAGWVSGQLLGLYDPSVAQAQLAIRGGKVWAGNGETYDGGTVLVRDGRIEAVGGADLNVPIEYKVIDAAGHVVTPGMVLVHTSGGMGQANERNPNVPFVTVLDTIDAQNTFFEECRRNGITSAAIVPGNSTLIGGQAAVLKTAGLFVHDMAFQPLVGIKISLQPPAGSRMSHLQTLRRELKKAVDKKSKAADSDKPDAAEKPASDGERRTDAPAEGTPPADGATAENAATPPTAVQEQQGLEILGRAIDGEILTFIYCENAMDVGQALRLIDEFRLKPVLVLGKDCDKAATVLGARKFPIVLDSEMVFWRTNPRTQEEERINLPQVFQTAGLEFMFQADVNPTRASLGSNYLWYQAALAVKAGVDREQAWAACTRLPAQTLGVEGTVGTLEPGKDADIVLWTGDPLSPQSWVSKTIIRGDVVYEKETDDKLRRLTEQAEK